VKDHFGADMPKNWIGDHDTGGSATPALKLGVPTGIHEEVARALKG